MNSQPNTLRRTLAPFVVVALAPVVSQTARAQTNGTWTTDGPGSWSDSGNWLGGNVASGATAIADFSTLNITGDHVINIDAPYTIGTLVSRDLTTLSNSWTFDGSGPLTLDNGISPPVIDIINRTPVISAPLAGTNGFSKTGQGTLTLSGNNAGLSGTIDLPDVTGTNSAGLVLASDTAIGGVTTVNINGTGTTSGQYFALSGGVTLGSGVTLNLASQGGNSAPAGGIRSEGTSTDVNTIEGPVNLLQTNVRIANNTAGRLDITGPITADGSVTQFYFRFGKNEGIRITNPANSWSGTTIHAEETLWFEPDALPTTTNLSICQIGPGTVQTSGTFNRALGSDPNQVRFFLNASRAQGFGARGGPLTLNFGGAGADVLFDTSGTAPDTRIRTNTLVLNGGTADNDITLVNPLDLNGADRTIQASAMTAILQGGVKGGAFGITKTGNGTLNLSGPVTYSGNTSIAAGTLQTTGGDDRLPIASTLAFTGTGGTLDLTTTSQTLATLTVPNLLAASYAISGNSLTLNGAGNLQIGPGGAVTNAHSVNLDMSGLNEFDYDNPSGIFRVGLKAGSSNSGNLGQVATATLADSNTITAATIAVGDVGANNHGGTSTLNLGAANLINADTISLGTGSRANSNLLFDPLAANPTATFRGTDGTSPVNLWRVGQTVTFNSTTWTDIVNLTAGTIDAHVTGLTIGTADIGTQTGRGGIENASFIMGNGTLEASSMILGRISGTGTITSTMAGNGTFTLNHANGLLQAASITLAENTVTATGGGARSVSGTLNLTNGTLEATTIGLGAQTGNATATAAVNWTDGTIRNLNPSGLAINSLPLNLLAGTHTFDATGSATIAVDAASSVSGAGGITKTGTGTLSLQGTNSYTGPTDVQAGTLAIANSFPSGPLTVDPAATLELANVTLAGQPALDIDGSLNLTGPVKLALPANAAAPGNFPMVLQYGSIAGSGNLTTDYRNASFTAGATSADLVVGAGIPLTWTGVTNSDWDVDTAINWQDGSSSPETFFWADSVTFDSVGSGVPIVNLTGEMRPAAVNVNEASVDYVFSGPGFISGTTGLTKDGAAKLTIATNNTNSGITTIHAGTLEIGSGGTTGSLGSGDIVNDGALVFNRSNGFSFANAISGTGSVTKLGAGFVTFTADHGYTGGTTIGAGELRVGSQTTAGSLGTGAIVNDGTLRLNRADGTNPYAYTFANDISGSGGMIIGQNVAGSSSFDSVATLTGNNTFAGNISVFSGGLRILSASALGTGPKNIALTNGSNGRPQFYLDGSGGDIAVPADVSFTTSSPELARPCIGNLAGDNVINGPITLQSGGGDTTVSVLAGSLTLNGNITANTTSVRRLVLGGNPGTAGTVNGLMSDGSTTLGVRMNGSNTWTLTGNNSYTSLTEVNSGTLLINGTQNLATGNVTVASGATLGGTGTIGGNTTVNAGGILAPGTSVGTLTTVNSVILAGTLAVEINGASADRLDVGGTLDITNATIDFDEVAAAGGSPIIIASYGNLSGSQFATVTDLPAGYSLDYNYNSLKQIALVTGVSTPFGTWIDSFAALTDPADKLPSADPDDDGANNLLEFALNGDPTDGGNNGLSASLVQDATAPAGDELTLIIAARRGASFGAGPNGTRTATLDGVTYTIEGAPDLNFPGGAVSHAGASDTAPAAAGLPSLVGEDWEYHTFSLDSSENLPNKGFLRAVVE